MAKQKLKTQVRREQIAQAALAVVAGQGLAGLNVTAVAREVGIVPSALYRHFKNRDGILDAVLDLIRKRLLDNVAIVRQQPTDPLSKMRTLLLRHSNLLQHNQAILRIVFSEAVYGRHPGRRVQIRDIITGYLHAVASLIREGQKAGHIRTDADPDMLSVMFLGLIQPAAIIWHINDGKFDLDRQIKDAWQTFCRAIESKPRAPEHERTSLGSARRTERKQPC